MAIQFTASLRRPQTTSRAKSFALLTAIVASLALWAWWFAGARLTVYATARDGRLEASGKSYTIDAPATGRLSQALPASGHVVHAGDVIAEFDASPETLDRATIEAGLPSAEDRVAAVKSELASERRAQVEDDTIASAARSEYAAQTRSAELRTQLALEELRKTESLASTGLVSAIDVTRAQTRVGESRENAVALAAAADRREAESRAQTALRAARVSRLERDLAEATSSLRTSRATTERLDYEVARRTVRAPVDGVIAEVAELKPGNVVQSGTSLCTIVPRSDLYVVARFTPGEAMGRVRIGQVARLRLDGFSWTRFGTVAAKVSQVDTEVRDGLVRVELALDERLPGGVALQHGMPATVDVAVERVSPWAMAVRRATDTLSLDASASSR